MKKDLIKMAIILSVVAVLLFFGDSVFASDFKISPPTENEDRTPIFAELGYKIHCGIFSKIYTLTKDAGGLEPQQDGICYFPVSQVIPSDGKWYCVATAYYLHRPDKESTWSNEIFFVVRNGEIPDTVPRPPSFGFSIGN